MDDDLIFSVLNGWTGHLGILEHCHSAGSIIKHVCTDVEGIDTAFGRGMQIDQVFKLCDEAVKEIICILLRSRSFLFSS